MNKRSKVGKLKTGKVCPVRELLTRFGDKWSILVICTLSEAPGCKFRFSELQKKIEGISQRMLTMTLRNLERDGVLTRHIYPEVPPRVEYRLTSLGQSLLVPVQSLVSWVESNWTKVEKSRESFDKHAFDKQSI